MHELGIMYEVVETALRVAKENDASKVTRLTLKIGVVSGVMPDYMQFFFDFAAKDTIAEGAEIEIIEDPAVFRCRDCGSTSEFDEFRPDYTCQSCGGESLALVSGNGFQIVSVAIT